MSGPWILDANVFMRAEDDGCFGDVVTAAGAVGAVVPAAVRDEVGGLGARKQRPEFKAQADAIDASDIGVLEIPLNSEEAAVYAKLRAATAGTGNAGECACIALATGSSHIFVTGDAKATFLGVAELEDRVRSIPSFLAALVEAGELSEAIASSIVDGSLAQHKPSWWDARMKTV